MKIFESLINGGIKLSKIQLKTFVKFLENFNYSDFLKKWYLIGKHIISLSICNETLANRIVEIEFPWKTTGIFFIS